MPYADSAQVEITLDSQGVWIHDPDDPSGTIRQFLLGEAQRSDSYDPNVSKAFYAGRAEPVFDFGEHEEFNASVTIDVVDPDELTSLRKFASLKKPLWFRDNRGRSIYGAIVQFRVNDTPWGATVSFAVEGSDRDVTTALASLTESAPEPEQP